MSVYATEGTTGSTGSTGSTTGIFAPANATAADVGKTQDDSQMFMQLMVAQLKYQNPMNPTDSTQFLTQQAQFTQLQSIQEIQDEMSMMLSSQLAFGASSMIGKQVSWTDSDGTTHTGTVQSATFQSTGPVLSVDGTDVPLLDVTSLTGDQSAQSTQSTQSTQSMQSGQTTV